MTVVVPEPPRPSPALYRIRAALQAGAPPGIRWVYPTSEAAADADLWLLLIVGQRDATARQVTAIRRTGARVAAVQVVWRSSLQPSAAAWAPVWAQCAVVWSTYRLPTTVLYHAPFGVAPLFPQSAGSVTFGPRPWWVMTSGIGWLQEGVREVHRAAVRTDRAAWHLGPSLGRPLARVSGVRDPELARLYAATQIVSGLRRCEGFELACAEGLTCGARPLLFDRPHYTDWYGAWADYLPETDRTAVEEACVAYFRTPPRAVTAFERQAAVLRFDWPTLTAGFWERLGC